MARTKSPKTKSESSVYIVNRAFTKNNKITSEDSDSDTIEVHNFEVEPSKVGLTKGITLNLGNFEFARVDITCIVPSYIEEIDSAYEFANNFVETKLRDETKEIRDSLARKSAKDHSPL